MVVAGKRISNDVARDPAHMGRPLVGHSVYMVVAGSGISKDVVDQVIAPAIMKNPRYRWRSDTGAFNEVEVQRRYSKSSQGVFWTRQRGGGVLRSGKWRNISIKVSLHDKRVAAGAAVRVQRA